MSNYKEGKQNGQVTTNDTLDDANFGLLLQAGSVLSKAREKELSQYKLTLAQSLILHNLTDEKIEGSTIYELSSRTTTELSSVLNLVNRMAKKGLVKKSRNSDKRTIILITKKGQEFFNKITRLSIEMVFSVLTEDEKQQLEPILQKLRDKGREMLGIDFKPPFLTQ